VKKEDPKPVPVEEKKSIFKDEAPKKLQVASVFNAQPK
jgi:hypothetical protein